MKVVKHLGLNFPISFKSYRKLCEKDFTLLLSFSRILPLQLFLRSNAFLKYFWYTVKSGEIVTIWENSWNFAQKTMERVCVCVKERDRERKKERFKGHLYFRLPSRVLIFLLENSLYYLESVPLQLRIRKFVIDTLGEASCVRGSLSVN